MAPIPSEQGKVGKRVIGFLIGNKTGVECGFGVEYPKLNCKGNRNYAKFNETEKVRCEAVDLSDQGKGHYKFVHGFLNGGRQLIEHFVLSQDIEQAFLG
ncbi:hypothetical protein GCM10027299_51270 [Larkinella ripae]